jgi:hypothetical protein
VKSFLPRKKLTSWESLVKLYPHLQLLKTKEREKKNTRTVFITLFAALIIVFIGPKYDIQIYSVFPLLLAILDIKDGTDSLVSGVFYDGVKSDVSYYYDEEKRFTWISKSQIVFSTILSLAIVWVIVQYLITFIPNSI